MTTYVLRIVEGPAGGRELAAATVVEIGRDPTLALALPDDGLVSHRHARIAPSEGGLVLEDLGSRNGTFVNGARVVAPTPLGPGDRIVVGETTIEVAEPPLPEYVLLVSPRDGSRYERPLSQSLEVGRDPSAGLPLPDDGQISWHHARLSPAADGVEVEDLGSSNGTFVNGARIARPTIARPGDRILVGDTTIEASAPSRVDTAVAPALLSADTLVSEATAVPVVREFVLEVVGRDGAPRELRLDAPLDVGRDPGAGLVLDDHLVSRLHARLTPGLQGISVEDLGSRNGTFVNGARIETPTVVKAGDLILVGDTTIAVQEAVSEALEAHTSMREVPAAAEPEPEPEPPAPEYVVQVVEGWAAGRQFPLTGPLEVGRDPTAGVPLVEDDRVSPRHARLTPSGEGAFLEDLGSDEGTFVNDVRIDDRTLVRPGDRVLVGSTVFRILPPQGGAAGPPG